MEGINSAAEAVLRAAESWVAVQEALVAARQNSRETEAEEEAADIAGTRLVLAVKRWQSERGPQPIGAT